MSNICSLSMDNTHNNVEFGVLQKTSKQSLISIFFYIGRGDTLDYTKTGPPPTISWIRPCLSNLLPTSHSTRLTRQTDQHIITQFQCQTDNFKSSFLPSTINAWNNTLNSNLRQIKTITTFKRTLHVNI